MSAGELFDLIRPVVILFSALLSSWVLYSARKRFTLASAAIWTVGTLLLPLVVLPIYLCVILLGRRPVRAPRWSKLAPLVYGLVLVVAVSTYFYLDEQTIDAHLARATQARLDDQHTKAIDEYRRALSLQDDPHIHKLLAIELAEAGYVTEAISEFRLAEQGGEPDDLIHYRVGLLLERIEQFGQARLEFQAFLLTQTCTQPDRRCESARERIARD